MPAKSFLWGSATASYQCEGAWDEDGKGCGEWDTFSHESPLNINGANGDVSCDFYHHFREDIDLMAEGGQNSFRFSVSWARIMPAGRGGVNRKGVEFYDAVIDHCIERGLEPNVTLFHYDLPSAIAGQGGFANRQTIDDYVDYARACFEAFGDRVKLWTTINEPRYYAYCSNIVGNYPPNHSLDFDRYYRVYYNQIVASARAIALYHSMGMPGRIGLTIDSCNVELAPGTRDPEQVKRKADLFYGELALDASIRGELPEDLIHFLRESGIDSSYVTPGDEATLRSGTVDFIGLNVYNRMYLTNCDDGEMQVFHNNLGAGSDTKEGIRIRGWFRTTDDPGARRNLWGREIYPRCMYNALMELRGRYGDVPVFVTENGHGCYETPGPDGRVEDDERIEVMQGYIENMLLAMDEGCDVRGYYAWSSMDLYSWINGYEKRYGLVRVDFDDSSRPRVPKKSYYWYRDFIAAHRFAIP